MGRTHAPRERQDRVSETASEKSKKAKAATVRLTHPEPWSGEIAVGTTVYAVVNGVVEVAAAHVGHALQAGFRPEEVRDVDA